MSEQGETHSKDERFAKVPMAVVHDHRLTDGDVRLYAHMHWRYGANKKNFESRLSMAEFLKVTERTITNRIHNLEMAGWLVVVLRTSDPTTGDYRTPFYHIFEERKEAARFRKTYQCKDGETIRPRPFSPGRKVRKHSETAKTRLPKQPPGKLVSTGNLFPGGVKQVSPYLDALSKCSEWTPQAVEKHPLWVANNKPRFAPLPVYKKSAATLGAIIEQLESMSATPEDIESVVTAKLEQGKYAYPFEWLPKDMAAHLERKARTGNNAPKGDKALDDVAEAKRKAAIDELNARNVAAKEAV